MTISEKNSTNEITSNEDVFVFPASYGQKRMWFLDQFEPNSPYYNIPVAFKIKGRFDQNLFMKTINKIIDRHESFRTTFANIKGEPFQVITPNLTINIPIIALSLTDKNDIEKEVNKIAVKEARAPFNLSKGPLFRVKIISLTESENVVLITMHHIISDGWSMGILVGEITSIYSSLISGRNIELPELEIQYADYSDWQNNYLSDEVLDNQLNYWKTQLENSNSLLELPTDRPRKAIYTNNGSSIERILSSELITALQKISNGENASLFMILITAFNVLLSRYSGQEDINIGTPIANRTDKEVEKIIGLFINTLVIRTDLSGNPTFRELLRKVRKTNLEAFEHQDLPFEMLVDAIQPDRNMSYAPLFQVMFILQNNPISTSDLSGIEVSMLDVDMGTSTSDITFTVSSGKNGASCAIEFNTDLYDETTIQGMFNDFEQLLREVISNPDEKISNYQILNKKSNKLLIKEWNSRVLEIPKIVGIHSLFERRAAETPNAIAVVDDNTRITYQELNEQANLLANYLAFLKIDRNLPIGISQNKTVNLLISVLGVLKSGFAYLPLDPTYPEDRLNYMIEDSQIELLITDTANKEIFRDDSQKIVIDELSKLHEYSKDNLNLQINPSDLAYIIYTSGSTGKAKGTMIQHNSLINIYLGWEEDYGLLNKVKNHLQMASFSFDVFGGDWTRALCSGGKLVLVSRENLLQAEKLYELIRNEKIEIAEFVPAVLRNLINYVENNGYDLMMFKVLIAGSDIWYVKEYNGFKKYISQETRLVNSFGLTETTIDSTFFEDKNLDLPEERLVPIGKPFPNIQLYILDKYLNVLPIGVKGELYIGGISLARGYYKRPNLTAEKFIPNPFTELKGERLYRTGDVARYLSDGNIEFLGRADNQIKLRGFRIELGEIENALSDYEKVKETIVIAKKDESGENKLIAYIIAEGEGSIELSNIREFLGEKVPDYMIPSAFLFLKKMPLTPNGKVDRNALPDPDHDDLQKAFEIDYLAPRNNIENQICRMWEEILKLDKVGIKHNFFILGGHSLLATQVISRIKSELNVDLPLRFIFERPTIEDIALEVEKLKLNSGFLDDLVIEKRKSDENIPLSFSQERLWFLDQLEPNSPFYNIPESYRIKGEINFKIIEQCFNIIIDRHEILRTYFTSSDGTPSQIIVNKYNLEIPVIDLSESEDKDKDKELKQIVELESLTPIPITELPLFRIKLVKLKENDHVFLMTIHHIISDDWSTRVIIKELGILYESIIRNKEIPMHSLTIQYADYAVWQRKWLKGDILKAQTEFWKKQLSGIPSLLELPYDKTRPKEQTFNGDFISFNFDEDVVKKLNQVSKRNGVTDFMLMLAAFNVMLYKLSGQNDIVVGTPSANRNRKDIEPLIGFFVNTLSLRIDVSDNPSLKELLSEIKETTLNAYAHQDLPFEYIVEAIKPERNLSHSPIFQVMFVYQTVEGSDVDDSGNLSITPVESHNRTAKFDLTLFMVDSNDEIGGAFEFNTDLFERKSVERFVEYYKKILKTFLNDTSIGIEEISLLNAHEQKELVSKLNSTEVIPVFKDNVHSIFSEISKSIYDKVAVEFHESNTTFGQLDINSNKLANYLLKNNVVREDIIAICLPRSIELIDSLFAVLKSGAAYLPIDSNYPQDRINYITNDSNAQFVITHSSTSWLFKNSNVKVIELDKMSEIISQENEAPPDVKIHKENICYVIYTSGSTGKPKGTLLTHEALLNYLSWATYSYPYEQENGSLVHSTVSFDATITSIFPPLLRGKKIVLMNESGELDTLAKTIIAHNKFSTLKITPAHLELLSNLISKERLKDSADAIVIGGENLTSNQIRKWQEEASETLLFNEYGPTEAVVGCIVHDCTKYKGIGSVPIGRVIPNMQIYVLDKNLAQVPLGVLGELHLGGISLARGYLNKPSLTSEKFIPNPFSKIDGERIYKTGDIVKIQADGNLVFIRRVDDQVKVRGYRIELGEIESKLSKMTDLKECVVDVKDYGEYDKRIVAYIVSEKDIDFEIIKQNLKIELPDYMIPSSFVSLQEIPLTLNGKVDRKKLSVPEEKLRDDNDEIILPQTETEKQIADIWKETLKINRLGVYDNFFDLGGHSLLVTKLVIRISKKYKIDFPIKDVFSYPTIAEQSNRIDNNEYDSGSAQKLPVLTKAPTKDNIPLSFTQRRLWFLDKLDPGLSTYNMPMAVNVNGKLDIDVIKKTIDYLASRHEAFRTNFIENNGVPSQHISKYHSIQLVIEDLRNFDELEKESKVNQTRYEETSKPFNLSNEALIRFKLVILAENEFILFFTMHHIISDGWSVNILVEEFSKSYLSFLQNQDPNLPELNIQYSDFAIWQQKNIFGEILDSQIEYWKKKLYEIPSHITLPTDKKRPYNKTFSGSHMSFNIPESLVSKIREFNKKYEITPYMFLLGSFQILLARYSGQNDICVGTPVANRTNLETEKIIGFFANTLVMRNIVKGNKTIEEYFKQVKQTTLESFTNQDVPFEKLVELLKPERDLARTPIFQVMFVQQNNISNINKSTADIEIKTMEAESTSTQYDLTLSMNTSGDNWEGTFEFNTDLFESGTIVEYINSLKLILKEITGSKTNHLYELEYLDDATKTKLLNYSYGQAENYSSNSIIQKFKKNLRQYPNKVACEFEGSTITFAELDETSDIIQNYLLSNGFKLEDKIGVMIPNSIDLVKWILGILKAGCCYLPIDVNYPIERIKFIVNNSAVKTVVTSNDGVDLNNLIDIGVNVFNINSIKNNQEEHFGTRVIDRDNLAYIIYTSGSTGNPKGVMINHKGLLNLVENQIRDFEISEKSRLLQFASISFDASISEIFTVLLSGATLILADREKLKNPIEVKRILKESNITVTTLPPSLLQVIDPTGLDNLHTVISAGEKLSFEVFNKWKNNRKVLNAFGPTESTVGVSSFNPVTLSDNWESIPIGYPINNVSLFLLDPDLNLVEQGTVGELFISGDSLARGYINNPKQTAEKFIPHPFSKTEGERLYRSGDLAKFTQEGLIEFVGRIDKQVKVRGFRIELTEIEIVLKTIEDIIEAVVVIEGDGDKAKLIGIVKINDDVDLEIDTIRKQVSTKLPDYMIPGLLVKIDEIPLTNSGKIDRKKLTAWIKQESLAKSEYVAPTNETEVRLLHIWEELLDIKGIGINDNFFELGGHSLLSTQLVSRIIQAFKIDFRLKDVFENATVKAQAYKISRQTTTSTNDDFDFSKIIRPKNIPLSFAQQRLWVLDHIEAENAVYNIPTAFKIIGKLNIDAIEKSLTYLVNRHESLRTNFYSLENIPYQKIHDAKNYNFKIDIKDISDLSDDTKEQKIIEILTYESQFTFDLERDKLFRFAIIKLSENEYIISFVFHHIITDGWSINLLLKEFSEVYSAVISSRKVNLAEIKIQYTDFSIWQNNYLKGKRLESQLHYWKKNLQGSNTILDLPLDKPRPKFKTFKGGKVEEAIEDNIIAKMKMLSSSEGITPFMILVSVFYVLLYKYTGDKDINIGTPIANRTQYDTEKIVGFFANTLVIRTILEGNPTFHQLLERVRESSLNAFDNQDVPFEQIVELLQPERDLARSPLFQVMFVLQNNPSGGNEGSEIKMEPVEPKFNLTQYELTLSAEENNTGFTFWLEYNSDLFEKETTKRMLNNFSELLKYYLENPSRKIDEYGLVKFDSEFNKSRISNYAENSILEVFESIVKKRKTENAVIYNNSQISYEELDKRSNDFALHLISLEIKPEEIIAVMLPKGIDLIISILAILKAGGTYLPIDKELPKDRIQYMLSSSKVEKIITNDQLYLTSYQIISNECILNCSEQVKVNKPIIEIDKANLAYVIYTSGSTGNPKGVMLTHEGLLNLTKNQISDFGVDENSKVLQFASLSFDASISEIFMALLSGAKLYLTDIENIRDKKKLVQFINSNKINIVTLPPSLLTILEPEDIKEIETLISAGEILSPDIAAKWKNKVNLINAYGPTESTVGVTFYNVGEISEKNKSVSIGKSINNVDLFVLDDGLNIVPKNVVGQIYIGGKSLARGYTNDAIKTAESFIPNPFSEYGERIYKTGDNAKYDQNGNLEFIGRVDSQIKLRGYRIELGEIENVIREQNNIIDAVVDVSDKNNNQFLAAYLLVEKSFDNNFELLKEKLSDQLPNYMIPNIFLEISEIPKSSSGKVDRKKLKLDLENKQFEQIEYVAPRNVIEKKLVVIWSELLGVENISINDNFFSLGGHSLLAIQLIGKIENEFDVELEMVQLFNDPTISALAKEISRESISDEDSNKVLVEFNHVQDTNPIFFIHPSGGSVHWYTLLAREFRNKQSFFGIQALGIGGKVDPQLTIEEMATTYIKAIKNIKQNGPYIIGSWSMGVVIAYEIAHQLEKLGEIVEPLIILDQGPELPNAEAEDTAEFLSRMFMGRISFDLDELREMSYDEQLKVVLKKAKKENEFPKFITFKRFKNYVKILKIQQDAWREYRIPQIHNDLVLIKARDSQYDYYTTDQFGWEKYVKGNIRVFETDGDHNTMLHPRFVKNLANLLTEIIIKGN